MSLRGLPFLVFLIQPAWSSLEQGKKLQHFLLDMVAKLTSFVSRTGSGFRWVGRTPLRKFLLSTLPGPRKPILHVFHRIMWPGGMNFEARGECVFVCVSCVELPVVVHTRCMREGNSLEAATPHCELQVSYRTLPRVIRQLAKLRIVIQLSAHIVLVWPIPNPPEQSSNIQLLSFGSIHSVQNIVMVRLETVLHIWYKLISMQILIIIMQISILADDERTGLMNIIILLGLTNAMVMGIRLKYSFSSVDNITKLWIAFRTSTTEISDQPHVH